MGDRNGYVKLFRSMTSWEWYDDINTKVVFLHLLLVANWERGEWNGVTIERGQRLTSIAHLAEETSLSERNVRTALNHLKKTGEVTIKATNKYTLITIENYEKFQDSKDGGDKQSDKQSAKRVTSNRQASDKQVTTNKEEKEEIEEKEYYSSLLADEHQRFVEFRKARGLPVLEEG